MPIGILGMVLIQIGLTILSRLLAPRLPRPKPQPFQSPTTEIGARLPRGFGIYQTSGVITLVKEKRSDQLEIEDGDNKGFVGTVYYAKVQMVCGFGPADILYDVIFDEKALSLQPANKHQSIDGDEPLVVTPKLPVEFSSATQPITLTVAARQMFGGLDQEGGVQGEMRIYPGQPNQVIDPLVSDALDDFASRYPHLIHVVFGTAVGDTTASGLEDKWYWGANIGQVRPVSLILGYYPDDLLGNGGKVGQDANWVEVIFKCLTNPIWGKKTPAEKFNLENWIQHAQAALEEQRGVSDTLADRSLDDFIDDVLTHHEAALVTNPVTGLLELRTARADYNLLDLLQITEENSREMQRGEAQYVDTINEIKVRYRRFLSSYSDPVVGEILTEDLKFNGGGIFAIFTTAGRNISDVHVYVEGTDPVTAQVELTNGVDYKVSAESGTIVIYNTDATTTHQIVTVDYIPAPVFSGFVDDVATAQNLAVRYIMGRQKSETYDYPMFTTEFQAQRKADLLRKTTSRRLAIFQWKMGRAGAQLAPLDVVRINGYGVVNQPVRITKVTIGTMETPEVTIEAVEDVFGEELGVTFPPNLDTDPTPPVDEDVPPLAALYCIDEVTLGVQASDETYNIEIEEADDTSGTGAAVITTAGGVPGDTTAIAITEGKTHRGRHIRGTSVGPWTAWLEACPVGEDPGCVLPTMSDLVTADNETGTWEGALTDPQGRVQTVEGQTVDPDGSVSSWAVLTAPYTLTVDVAEDKISYLRRRYTFFNCAGNEETRTAEFPVTTPGAPEEPGGGSGEAGSIPCVDVVFHAAGSVTDDWIVPSTKAELPDKLRVVFDATGYNQCRVQYQYYEGDVAGPVGSFLSLECRPKFSTDDADFRPVGEIAGPSVALDQVSGPPRWSDWVTLPVVNQADMEFRRMGEGGDDATYIGNRHVRMQFRKINLNPEDPGNPEPGANGLLAHFMGPLGRVLDAIEGTGDGELAFEWDLNYTSDADAVADGWTVVKSGGGAITYEVTDTDGQAHVPKFTVVNDGVAYYERTVTYVSGHNYTAKCRMKAGATIGFDSGNRLEWNPGPGTGTGTAAWSLVSVSHSPSALTQKIRVGRVGGFFGIAGTYSCRAHTVQIFGASSGGSVMVRWEDQSGNNNHADLQDGDTAPTPLTDSVQMTGGARLKLPDNLLDGYPVVELIAAVKAAADPNSGQNNIWHLGLADSDYPNGSGNIMESAGRATAGDGGNPSTTLTAGRIYHVRVAAEGVKLLLDGEDQALLGPGAVVWDSSSLYIGGGVEFLEIMIFGLDQPLDDGTRDGYYHDITENHPDIDFDPPIVDPGTPGEPLPPLDGTPRILAPIRMSRIPLSPPYGGLYGTQEFYDDATTTIAEATADNILLLPNVFTTPDSKSGGKFDLNRQLQSMHTHFDAHASAIAGAWDDGLILGLIVADDIDLIGRWGMVVPSTAIDEFSRQFKLLVDRPIRCYVRCDAVRLETRHFTFKYLDGCIAQYDGPLHGKKLSIQNYISAQYAASLRMQKRLIIGGNLTNGGDGSSGLVGSGAVGNPNVFYFQSATDINRDMIPMAQLAKSGKSDGVTHWLRDWPNVDDVPYSQGTTINAALQDVADELT